MPRTARRKSKSGIYHVILRGVNRQQLFEDEEDHERFLFLLDHYKEICGFKLYAWCLMPNHIHLLMKEERDSLNTVFRRLGTSFVYWYNLKYERTGHLFQDRFKSEPVDDNAYFLTVLRYIHQNPVKAGLCSTAGEYLYSSYSHYFEAGGIDSEFVLGLISKDDYFRYHDEKANDICMEISEQAPKRLTDTKAKEVLKSLCGCENVSQFQALPESQKNEALTALLHAGGSIRQVSRLTGTSFGIVRKHI